MWRSFWDEFKVGLDPRTWPAMFIMLWDWFRKTKPIYWLRTHTIDRYHIVDIRSKHDDYKWGWVDRDHVMLLACFKILCDFVEKEMRNSLVDWDHESSRAVKAEVLALYRYWTVERPAAEKEKAEVARYAWRDWRSTNTVDADAQQKYMNLDRAFDEAEDAALIRLMAVRRYLWT